MPNDNNKDRGSAKVHGDDLETAIPRGDADRGDTETEQPEKRANVGQRLTGNKNAGTDEEGMSPSSTRDAGRPTRDDGDNDDEGALGSPGSDGERGYPRGN